MASWGKAVRESRRLIGELRTVESGHTPGEVRVVAMGGFVAAPVVQAARVDRAPVTLVNLDAVPGKANRWIAHRAARVLTAARVSAPFASGWTMVGPIARRAAMSHGSREECRARAGLDRFRSTLMVTGGSQGAASINGFVSQAVGLLKDEMSRSWQVLHQCGKGSRDDAAAAYARAGVPAVVQEFSDTMGDWWGAADLAVGRAGAGTVAEAWANRVPTLFMPYPYHRDQHQKINALALVEAGGARLLDDRIESRANIDSNLGALRELIRDTAARDRMRSSLQKLGPADGAEQAARALTE
jgi:UDP-N-acetylglucosamine--N-acetylmuramyl-(pentapeptide) pyrophosphoryl-undecaprenol N-acetylglucosamine transferase